MTLLVAAVLAPCAAGDMRHPFPTLEEAAQANERTIGVQFERDERFFDLLDDIGASLELAAGLRIVPIVGRNHVQNVFDLVYLDGVDFALARSDSIEYVRRIAGLTGVDRLTRSVAKIDERTIVLVARDPVADVADLEGRAVALGAAGSGEFVTGTLLFDTLGIEIDPIEADGDDAFARLATGDVAALLHLHDERDPLVVPDGTKTDGLVVLDLPDDDALAALYHRRALGGAALPGVAMVDDAIDTWAVDVSLVAYAWQDDNERTRRMARFVEALVDRLEGLQGAESQPEWTEVSLEADTPNLDGSPLVDQAIDRRAAAMSDIERNAETLEARVESPSSGIRLMKAEPPPSWQGAFDWLPSAAKVAVPLRREAIN